MKSQCWGREAKACLSECSGCCSLLKCQVLLKNNTPPSLSLALLPPAPCLPYPLPSIPLPNQTLASAGAEVEEWTLSLASPAGQTAAFLLPWEVFIYLFYFIFPISPLWPLRWKQWGWWNETISLFLFSLSSHGHTSSPDSFHFIPCLSWLSHDVVACSYRPKISQAPSNPSVR